MRRWFAVGDRSALLWVVAAWVLVLLTVGSLSGCGGLIPGGKAEAAPVVLPSVHVVAVGDKTWAVVGQFATETDREHGLMDTVISPVQAAVFTWGGSLTSARFWMLNTPQALSLLWVASGRVVGHVEMAVCKLSCPKYPAPAPFDVAVEASAGAFAGVAPGELVSFR